MDPIVITRRSDKTPAFPDPAGAITVAENDDNLDALKTAIEQVNDETVKTADFAPVSANKPTLVTGDKFIVDDSEFNPEDPEDERFKTKTYGDLLAQILLAVPDMTGAEIVAALVPLTGSARLPATAIRDLPTVSAGSPVTVTHGGAGGNPVTGDTLTANLDGGWSGPIQWTRNGADIVGATGATYVAAEADEGTVVGLIFGDPDGLHYVAEGLEVEAPAATAPAAFTAGQWTAAATATPGQISFDLTALPSDGGSAITALEYRVNTGSAIAFTGTGTGVRVVTAGLTAGTAVDLQVRAVNAVGAGAWSDAKNRTPLAGGSTPTLVQRTTLPSGAASRGEYVDAVAAFAANVTPGNTIIIYGSSNGALGTVDSSQAGDTPVVFDEEVFGGAAYWTQLGYILNAVGGPTTISMSSAGAGIHSLYAEEWSGIPAFNAAADVGVQAATPPTSVATPNATNVAVGVSFVSWSYFGNGLNGGTQAIPLGFTEGARYTSGAGGNAGRAQLIGGYRAETATGVKSATWPTWEAEFIVSQIMVMSAS
jgi:hypothetical protein